MDSKHCHIVCTHISGTPHFTARNNTGYGIILSSLAMGLKEIKKGTIYVHSISDSLSLRKLRAFDNLVYCGVSLSDLVKGLLVFDWRFFIFFIIKYKALLKVKDYLRIFLYFLIFTTKKNQIIRNSDVINIHGFDFHTIPFIEYFRKHDFKVVLSLHGLLSFDDNKDCHEGLRRYERDFFSSSDSSKFSITCVSTGIKNRLVAIGVPPESLTVIPNSVVFDDFIPSERFEGEWASYKWRVGLVGTLSKRKNQLGLFDLIDQLPEQILRQTCFLLVGKDGMNGRVQYKIANHGKGNVFYLGELHHAQMKSFYNRLTHNLVLSHSEGFGLSIIEAMRFGVPTFCFNDLDAVEDLFNDDSMCVGRSRNRYTEEFLSFLTLEWKSEEIIRWSDNYKYDNMIQNYAEILF